MHTILSRFDLDIDFWPNFYVFGAILELTFLKCVLCYTTYADRERDRQTDRQTDRLID